MQFIDGTGQTVRVWPTGEALSPGPPVADLAGRGCTMHSMMLDLLQFYYRL